jgi:hypothetical protein
VVQKPGIIRFVIETHDQICVNHSLSAGALGLPSVFFRCLAEADLSVVLFLCSVAAIPYLYEA